MIDDPHDECSLYIVQSEDHSNTQAELVTFCSAVIAVVFVVCASLIGVAVLIAPS